TYQPIDAPHQVGEGKQFMGKGSARCPILGVPMDQPPFRRRIDRPNLRTCSSISCSPTPCSRNLATEGPCPCLAISTNMSVGEILLGKSSNSLKCSRDSSTQSDNNGDSSSTSRLSLGTWGSTGSGRESSGSDSMSSLREPSPSRTRAWKKSLV